MTAARIASWGLLVAGLASLTYAGLQGELEVFVLLVVPVVAGSGPWAALGMLAAIAGAAGLVWTAARESARQGPPGGPAGRQAGRTEEARPEREGGHRRETKGGGVILLGPIPIAWGSDRSTLGWLVGLGLLLTLAAVALTLWVQP